MSFNGSGAFTINSAGQPVVAGTTITVLAFNALTADLATGLSLCVLKDGQQTVTANIPMGGFALTGVGTGLASRTSATRTGDVQDGTATFVAGGGSVDAITATYVPAITAVVDGMLLGVRATGANTTTTPTFAPSSLTARTIVKQGGQALVAGDIRAANHDLLLRYRASGTVWELLNPTPDSFSLDGTPDTDHTSNGPTTNTFNAGATITVMDLVYMGGSSKWLLTDADAAATAGGVMLAISLESKTDTQAMKVALSGTFVRDDTWNWTPGAVLYIDTATPGAIVATAPSGTDDVIRVVGHAVTADVIFFNPSNDYITAV